MAEDAVTIRIGADVQGAVDALRGLAGAAKKTFEPLEEASRKPDPFAPMAAQAEKLERTLKKTLSSSGWSAGLSAAAEKAATRFAEYSRGMELRAKSMVGSMGASGQAAGEALAKGLTGKAATIANELTRVYGPEVRAAFVARLGAMGEESGNNLLSGVSRSLRGGAEQATMPMVEAFSKVGTQVRGVFDPLFGFMLRGIAAVTGALAGIGAAAVTAGAEFESRMARVGAVAGATAAEMEQMAERARELGGTLPVSMRDSAQGMEALSQAGLGVNQVIGSIADVANLATAQQIGMEKSADMLASTMINFGLSASDAAHVTDVFNTASNKSLLTIDKLADGLRYAAPLAKTAGLSLEQTVAAMEALANAGLRGEQIGTGFRGVLSSLYNPSKQAADVLASLGVSVTDAAGKMRPFYDVLNQLATSGITTSQIFRVFGNEAATAATTLIRSHGALEGFVGQLMESGSTAEMVARQMETLSNKWTMFTNAIERTRIEVFDQIKSALVGATNGFKDLLDALGDWVERTGAAHKAAEAFVEGVSGGETVLEDFRAALASVNVEEVARKFKELGQGVKAVYGSLKSLAEMVPWKFLIENLDTLAATITIGWAAGKMMTAVETLGKLGNALRELRAVALGEAAVGAAAGGGTLVAGLATIGPVLAGLAVVAGLVYTAVKLVNDEHERQERVLRALAEPGEHALDQAELYTQAVKGNEKALNKLDEKYYQLAKARLKEIDLEKRQKESAEEHTKALQFRKEVLIKLAADEKDAREKEQQQLDMVDNAVKQVYREYDELRERTRKAMEQGELSAAGARRVLEEGLRKSIQDAGKDMEKLPDKAQAFKEAMERIGMSAGGVVREATKGLSGVMDAGGAEMLTKAQARIDGLEEKHREGLNRLGSQIETYMAQVLEKTGSTEEAIVAAYDKFAAQINNLPAGGNEALKRMFSGAAPEVKKALDGMLDMSKKAASGTRSAFEDLYRGLEGSQRQMAQKLTADMEQMLKTSGVRGETEVKNLIDQTVRYAGQFDAFALEAGQKRDAAIRAAKEEYDAWASKAMQQYEDGQSIYMRDSAAKETELKAKLAAADAEYQASIQRHQVETREVATNAAKIAEENVRKSGQTLKTTAGEMNKALGTVGEALPEGIKKGGQQAQTEARTAGRDLSSAMGEAFKGGGVGKALTETFRSSMDTASKAALETVRKLEASIRDLFEKSKIGEALAKGLKIPSDPITKHFDGILQGMVKQASAAGAAAGKAYAAAFAANSGGGGGGGSAGAQTQDKAPASGSSSGGSVAQAAAAAGLV